MRRTRLALLVLAAAVSMAPTCPGSPSSRTAKLGLAGIWPPGATLTAGQMVAAPESWMAFWSLVKAHGDHLAIHAPWGSVAGSLDAARANGVPMTVVTPIAGVDLAVAARAGSYSVRWWCVGNEVDADANLASEALDVVKVNAALKAANPKLGTCVVFQYERLVKMPDAATRVALFSDVDAVFFTTYPSVAGTYKTASSIPASYYDPIRTWTSKPIGFTEVGWPIDVGGAGEQSAFAARFLQSLAPRDAVLANWFSPFDMAGANPQPPTFGHMGFCALANSCRPALTAWDQARSVPFAGSP